jgi:hypothetical protein
MIQFADTVLSEAIVHKVGNKGREEDVRLSKAPIRLDDTVMELLKFYFLSPFKNNEYFHLYHETDINLNEVYSYVSAIFEDQGNLLEHSKNLALHLYEQSSHPKINEGEFYVVYLKDCMVDEVLTNAVGLFKSESRDTFLKVFPIQDNYSIERSEGININKLDKGCLIFNTEKEEGYVVAVVDNLSKGSEALYWKDDFLRIKQREDNFFQTQNVMKLYKTFVTEKLPSEFEVSKVDQVDMLNRSMGFFKEKDDFMLDTFTQEVIGQPEMIDTFINFKKDYENEYEMKVEQEFKISDTAVKKQAKIYKSIIKLDKNFHIYIHGDRELIKKGFDPTNGMNYYQLYFKDEN